jgi:uncharacterized protein (TIGR03084 family)
VGEGARGLSVFPQVTDFLDESEALHVLLGPLSERDFETGTQFKGYTIGDVVGHLHHWNVAADLSLRDEPGFRAFFEQIAKGLGRGRSLVDIATGWLGDLKGRALLEEWRRFACELAEHFGAADPKARVPWAGPDMSVRSSITARLMETWAHGQEVYDVLGAVRIDGDRIKNIAQLGVNTFGWTFRNRRLEVPGDVPHLRLDAPSGAIWEWNPTSQTSLVEGSAAEFCQVVTQVRSIGDTKLRVVGDTAQRWMSIAQCFAGPASDPPAAGTRFRQTRSQPR